MIARSHTLAPSRIPTSRNPLARYTPLRVTPNTRWRFARNRRTEHLRRIGGVANERQGLAIEELLRAEWREYVAEHDAEVATDPRDRAEALRRAADAQKAVLLWTRELTAASKPEPAPPQPQPTLTELLLGQAGGD